MLRTVFSKLLELSVRFDITKHSDAALRGRESGLPLKLRGIGTGPQARFTRTEIDFGDVVLFDKKEAEVDLVNTVRRAVPVKMQMMAVNVSGSVLNKWELTLRGGTSIGPTADARVTQFNKTWTLLFGSGGHCCFILCQATKFDFSTPN